MSSSREVLVIYVEEVWAGGWRSWLYAKPRRRVGGWVGPWLYVKLRSHFLRPNCSESEPHIFYAWTTPKYDPRLNVFYLTAPLQNLLHNERYPQEPWFVRGTKQCSELVPQWDVPAFPVRCRKKSRYTTYRHTKYIPTIRTNEFICDALFCDVSSL